VSSAHLSLCELQNWGALGSLPERGGPLPPAWEEAKMPHLVGGGGRREGGREEEENGVVVVRPLSQANIALSWSHDQPSSSSSLFPVLPAQRLLPFR